MRGITYAAGMLGTAALAAGMAGSMIAVSGGSPESPAVAPAHSASLTSYTTASGAVTETVSQVNRMTSARCYHEVRTEVRYYSHSRTKGWVRLAAPARTVTSTEHCYAA